jgi:hypothetical protein
MTQKLKSRGAPRGNHDPVTSVGKNARTHGFYAHRLDPSEARALKAADTYDLSEEIALLRLHMRRLNLASQNETDPQKLERVLRTISMASIAIARLLRAQLFAHPDAVKDETLAEEIGRIAEEVRQELAARPPTDGRASDPAGSIFPPGCRHPGFCLHPEKCTGAGQCLVDIQYGLLEPVEAG